MINRRDALALMAGTTVSGVWPSLSAAQDEPEFAPSRMGLVTYCSGHRAKAMKREKPDFNLFEPSTYLAHCRKLGAGGMQISLGVLGTIEAMKLRRVAEVTGMYIEAIIGVPREPKDVERFEAQMKTARTAGAQAVRTTIIPGRRYEYFDSLEMFREYEARGRRALELAAPIAEKLQLPLGVENHKDHRDDQRVALFEHISSEYVGACVDTGNSVALLEDPIGTAQALAPWAHNVHIKDQAVQLYEDGFLLGDIPLGQGFIDLKSIVDLLRQQKPDIKFSLELITRDPLKVPCLTEKYWATFPELPATDLARTLRDVREGATDNLQYVSKLSPEDQVKLEDANVRASLDYARDHLGL